jgi:hypothetical protein
MDSYYIITIKIGSVINLNFMISTTLSLVPGPILQQLVFASISLILFGSPSGQPDRQKVAKTASQTCGIFAGDSHPGLRHE